MSIDYEHGEMREGKLHVPLRHRERPLITSTEQAIAYVEEVLAELAPWPEEVTVVESASLEGRLKAIRLAGESPQCAKVHAIGAAVRNMLDFLGMRVRMPQLALVAGDYAELLFDTRAYQVLSQDAAPVIPDPLNGFLLGLLREAGEAGVSGTDLWLRLKDAADSGACRLSGRDDLMARLRWLRANGLASSDHSGRWRITGNQDDEPRCAEQVS